MSQFDLLVVVPAFNEERFIKGCLASIDENLAGAALSYRIVVVDNGSIDQTGAIARSLGATVITIERASVSRARNVGAAAFASRYIAFIDADVVVTKGWADAIERVLRDDSAPPLLTGCQYSIRDDAGWIEKYWFNNLRDKHLNGGNIIVSRSAFERVNGFDESLKTGEDYDFCVRAQDCGVQYRIDDGFRAIHLGYPRALSGFVRREIWHGEGDFKSWTTFSRSPVAILGIAYLMAVIVFLMLMVSGNFFLAIVLLMLFLIGNFALTALRFRGCNIFTITINTTLNMIYFFARAVSFFKALGNMKNSY